EHPPIYTIDLSLSPSQRYISVARDYKLILESLPYIFDELLESVNLPKKTFHRIARAVLRKMHSKEQTEELRGISRVSGVRMSMLVAYNVLLDLFMGCTSGGICVKEERKEHSGEGGERVMMHFRTLDWGMSALRKAVVQYEFVEKKGGPVVATSIGYVGFVGVLTGVRPGLSVSLNFRPYHNNDDSRWSNTKFYIHHLLVLLGFRPCISSHIRDFILKKTKNSHPYFWMGPMPSPTTRLPLPSLAHILKAFPAIPTTAAYLILSDGDHTAVLEKDRITAQSILSSSFITATNHDVSYELPSVTGVQAAQATHSKTHHFGIGMKDLVEESMDRKRCMVAKWERRCRSLRQKQKQEPEQSQHQRLSTGRRRRRDVALQLEKDEGYVSFNELKEWLLEFPTTNDETHFVTIMDPRKGTVEWVRMF
ncbi:uncharacterized protein BDR25DRAFT_160457, partial [Lindgomyces ingoldianus]